MEIRWLGKSTFEVRSSVGVVVVDHQGKLPSPSKLKDANTVFVYSSDGDQDHSSNDFQILTGPGEYEIGGLSIRGVATPADNPAISKKINTVYIVDADGLQVAMLGNPGSQPSAHSVEQISKVDVLIITRNLKVLNQMNYLTRLGILNRRLLCHLVMIHNQESRAPKCSGC